MRSALSLATATLALWFTTSAAAAELHFVRTDDLSSLDAARFAVTYDAEMSQRFGPAAGTEDLVRLKHRIKAGYGLTSALTASVEQTLKYKLDSAEHKLGVLVPAVRLRLSEVTSALSGLPVEPNAYLKARIRVAGRRDSSVVAGLGFLRHTGRLLGNLNLGLEATVPGSSSAAPTQVGPRYDAGLAFALSGRWLAAMEVWGHAAWVQGALFEHEHQGGPVLQWRGQTVRLGAGLSLGAANRIGQDTLWQWGGMLTATLAI